MANAIDIQTDERKKLNSLFKDKFEIDFEKDDNIKCSMNLLGIDMGLKPRDLLVLYDEIEKGFDIRIPEKDIVEGRFDSFENILDIICRCR